jgi:TolB-like protein/tetratricopeptide (TPR) repeat protein
MVKTSPVRRWMDKLSRLKGPIAAIAAFGAILSGLVGYYTTYKTVVNTQDVAVQESAAKTDTNSIAVLPFVNMSSDKDQEYFSDGLSEELLNQLAQVPQLKVIARTSSFAFKGKQMDVAAIAKVLKVGHVLEGSVRRSGNTLRMTAQLIRTSDSTHLWSQTYDRQMTDVFAVQDEISQAVVTALRDKLSPQQKVARTVGQTSNPQAYTEYLLGTSYFHQFNTDGYKLSKAAFEKAIALDPAYALAYAWLAFSEVNIADEQKNLTDRLAGQKRAMAWAEKSIAMEPELVTGYLARSRVREALLDFVGALDDAKRALKINPNDSGAHLRYGKVLMCTGPLDDALLALTKAAALDPLRVEAIEKAGLVLLAKGDHAQAQAAFTRALQLQPNFRGALYGMGLSFLLQGDKAKAGEMFDKLPTYWRNYGNALLQMRGVSEADADAAHAAYIKDNPTVSDYKIAALYALRGKTDKAFEWLQRAYETRWISQTLKFDPLLNSLHSDPRFNVYLKKLGVGERKP